MTEPLPSNEPSGPETEIRRIIPYRRGSDDLPNFGRRIGEAIGGAILAAIAIFALIAVWVIANLNLHPSPTAPKPPLVWGAPTAITIFVLGAMAAVTAYMHIRLRKRAFTLGVLIGVGLAALIEGACFAGAFR